MAAQLATQRAEQQATELAEHRAQELVTNLGLAPEQAARQAAKQAAQQAARQVAQQAVRLVAQEKVRKIREAFTKHTYSQSSTKAPEAKARQNIRLEGEILDLYFDGKGYLFVLAVDLDTVRRAVKLAKRTNIYIIAYNASKDVVQMVKRTRGVDLYRLSDMAKTTGVFGGSDFEPFMLAQGKMFTKK
jgi:hypothetical protein